MFTTMTVKDLMCPAVITIESDSVLGAALQLMLRRHVRHLCVTEGPSLRGVITDRDIHRALPSPLTGAGAREYEVAQETIPVGKVMTRDPIWVTSQTGANEAVRQMLDHRIGCLPVVDGGDLVGILTRADALVLLEAFLVPDELRELRERRTVPLRTLGH